jgi:uncharacterized damage-inducible protein DinB
MSAIVYFRAMACNNAWANHRLLGACSRLSAEALAATRTSFFPTIIHTLNHILTVDWFYVSSLEGASMGYAAFDPEVPCPQFADLAREQRAVDLRLIGLVDAMTDAELHAPAAIVRGSSMQTERRDLILLHLFEHQIHHRGQVHAMLAGTDVAPPQLDEFFMADERALRQQDLAALGLDEDRIWRDLPARDPR